MKTVVFLIFALTSFHAFSCGMAKHNQKSEAEQIEYLSKIFVSESMSEADAVSLASIYVDLNAFTNSSVSQPRKIDGRWVMQVNQNRGEQLSEKLLTLNLETGMLSFGDWQAMSADTVLSIRISQLKAQQLATQQNAKQQAAR